MKKDAFPKTKNEQNTVKPAIIRLLDKHDWFHWAVPNNGMGQSGISDRHAVWNGIFMVIEAKYGNKKPTPLQIAFLNSVRAAGHFAFVVNDTNIHWLDEFLTLLAASTKEVQNGNPVPNEVGAQMLTAIHALTALIPAEVAQPHALDRKSVV